MGDRSSSKAPLDHAKKMLRYLMAAPSGLRDEAYMQVCKQTTGNPKMESTIKGWELMSFFLCTFPPSKYLKNFLTDHITKNVADTSKPQIVDAAKLAQQRLDTILRLGQRKQVPSKAELICIQKNQPIPLNVYLVDGTVKTFNVDSFTFVSDVTATIAKKCNLVCDTPFSLYETAEANVERLVESKERIMDVLASWENLEIEEKEKKEEAEKNKEKKKELAATPSSVKYGQLLYKAKLVLNTSDPDIMADPEAVRMIYLQAVRDVVTTRYPVNEKDLTVLAALQLQATYGNFKEDTYNEAWMLSKIDECMPSALLGKKGSSGSKFKKDDKVCKEWCAKILAKYGKVTGFSNREAMLNYLDYVQEWVFYGATFFTVEQRQFKDYPSPLQLGITCEGVILMHPEKKTVLENYAYTDIVTWGHSDEKFIIVVGNIVQQRKLIFKSNDGKIMNHLIHDYVKFKVKNKVTPTASA